MVPSMLRLVTFHRIAPIDVLTTANRGVYISVRVRMQEGIYQVLDGELEPIVGLFSCGYFVGVNGFQSSFPKLAINDATMDVLFDRYAYLAEHYKKFVSVWYTRDYMYLDLGEYIEDKFRAIATARERGHYAIYDMGEKISVSVKR